TAQIASRGRHFRGVPAMSADFAVLAQYGVKQTGKLAGPVAQIFLCPTRDGVVSLFERYKFIGNVQSSKDGYAQRVNRFALLCNCAHFRIDDLGQLLNVCRVMSAQAIGLVIDIYRYKLDRIVVFTLRIGHELQILLSRFSQAEISSS